MPPAAYSVLARAKLAQCDGWRVAEAAVRRARCWFPRRTGREGRGLSPRVGRVRRVKVPPARRPVLRLSARLALPCALAALRRALPPLRQKAFRAVTPNVRGWFVANPIRARPPRSRSSDSSAFSSSRLVTYAVNDSPWSNSSPALMLTS